MAHIDNLFIRLKLILKTKTEVMISIIVFKNIVAEKLFVKIK